MLRTSTEEELQLPSLLQLLIYVNIHNINTDNYNITIGYIPVYRLTINCHYWTTAGVLMCLNKLAFCWKVSYVNSLKVCLLYLKGLKVVRKWSR